MLKVLQSIYFPKITMDCVSILVILCSLVQIIRLISILLLQTNQQLPRLHIYMSLVPLLCGASLFILYHAQGLRFQFGCALYIGLYKIYEVGINRPKRIPLITQGYLILDGMPEYSDFTLVPVAHACLFSFEGLDCACLASKVSLQS